MRSLPFACRQEKCHHDCSVPAFPIAIGSRESASPYHPPQSPKHVLPNCGALIKALFKTRAADGTRTHDHFFGKEIFYQLNYNRMTQLA